MTPASDQGLIRTGLAAAAAMLLLPAVLLAAATGTLTRPRAGCAAQPRPSALATATIPARYLALYQQAGRKYGIAWPVLAGIGKVESDHGRSHLPGVRSGANWAGAAGPMQFGTGGLAGNTWGGAPTHPATTRTHGHGIDGDHDGIVSVYDPGDAIPSAARYLAANGASAGIRNALLAYNHSAGYVSLVLSWAARYAAGGAPAIGLQDSLACPAASSLPAGTRGKIIAYAEAQLGKPYAWGATGPEAFDCSGLAMMAYRAAGITIPRTSQQQWAYGTRIPASQAKPGDLVFFAGADGTLTHPGHVGIILRPGLMIAAPAPGQDIQIQAIWQNGLAGFTGPAAHSS